MNSEARIGEATAALTARLTAWAVSDPGTKAHEFVRELLHHGWRPTGAYTDQPSPRWQPGDAHAGAQLVRAAMRPGREGL